MSDYISREKVVTQLCNILCCVDPQECQFQIPHDGAEHCTTVGAILDIPAADVRPVVLCRDCKWYDPVNTDWCCTFVNGPICPTEDDFCSFGERREDPWT